MIAIYATRQLELGIGYYVDDAPMTLYRYNISDTLAGWYITQSLLSRDVLCAVWSRGVYVPVYMWPHWIAVHRGVYAYAPDPCWIDNVDVCAARCYGDGVPGIIPSPLYRLEDCDWSSAWYLTHKVDLVVCWSE